MKIRNITLLTATLLFASLFSGCHLYKEFEMPQDTALEKEYVDAINASVDTAAFGNLPWQQVFTDSLLADLIERALANNVDLNNAKLNVDIAQTNLRGARLSFYPSAAISPSGGVSSVGGNTVWSYNIPLSVSWEADIFAKLKNTKRSAEATVRQTEDYTQAVRSQIIGAVANCYYTISALKNQVKLNKETAEIWRKNVEVMRDYKMAGRTNEAAVVQSQASYLGVLSSITDLELQIEQLNNTLSLLLNEMPQEWPISENAVLNVPKIYRDGVPMRELAARPDVRAAQENLAIAYYAINVAKAAFYPSLTINGSIGYTNPGNFVASLLGSAVAPLFSRGQNKARLEAAQIQQQQTLNTFAYTIMNAASEVSNAMAAYDKSNQKALILVEQVDQLEKAVDYTKELFKYGGSTYLEVLTAQSNLLGAQMNQISCDLSKSIAVINLYQALGGGR